MRYFWDVDTNLPELTKRPTTVITRILDLGDINAINWLTSNFSREEICDTLKQTRNISPRSASFWANVYNIPISELICFQKPYLTTRSTLWPY